MIYIAWLIPKTRPATIVLVSTVLVAIAFAASTARAQQSTTIPLSPNQRSSADTSGFNNSRDPEQSRMLKDMTRERNQLRQKQIVEDTNQLLDLARQLKDAVDKSSKDQLSLSVVNTATEIEKLAKTVKEKMRDGQ
jgi:phage-related tail protein